MTFQRLRGFKDIAGDEAAAFRALERAAGQVFESFGFSEIRIPILEEKKVFTHALGLDTDVVQKEMYEFTDRSKTEVALRPEWTAGVVRAYLENNFDKTDGFCKFYYLGPMFRNERPQAGRLRQFHQIGVELLGTDSPYSDAEAIHCLTAFLDRIGIRGYEVRVNNLGTFEERREFKIRLKAYFEPQKKALCEDCARRLETNVLRILDCKNPDCGRIIKDSPLIHDFLTPESKTHGQKALRALSLAGVKYSEAPRMVRGLDYYTKTVFEVSHPSLGAQDAIAAGGRYDHLIETFGGPKLGAVGFAAGLERLVLCLGGKPAGVSEGVSFFVASLGDAALEKGFELLSSLRGAGLAAEADFSAKSLKSQMRTANKKNAAFVVIIGDQELEKKVLVLKNMASGEQTELPLDGAVEILKKKGLPNA